MPGSTFAGGTYRSGISGDGSTIMGYGWVCAGGQSKCKSTDTVQVYRWTSAHGLKQLPMNIASAITGDGKMVAGGDNWWNASGQTGIFGRDQRGAGGGRRGN
jgi:hypothetical protein